MGKFIEMLKPKVGSTFERSVSEKSKYLINIYITMKLIDQRRCWQDVFAPVLYHKTLSVVLLNFHSVCEVVGQREKYQRIYTKRDIIRVNTFQTCTNIILYNFHFTGTLLKLFKLCFVNNCRWVNELYA